MNTINRLFGILAVVALSGCGGTVNSPVGGDDDDDGSTPAVQVSYITDVYPMFERRNCVQCHSGGGPGKDDGGLMLDNGSNPVYREVTEEVSPNHEVTRIELGSPGDSLMLVMPLGGVSGHVHGIFFLGSSDPDYQLLLEWIADGAASN